MKKVSGTFLIPTDIFKKSAISRNGAFLCFIAWIFDIIAI